MEAWPRMEVPREKALNWLFRCKTCHGPLHLQRTYVYIETIALYPVGFGTVQTDPAELRSHRVVCPSCPRDPLRCTIYLAYSPPHTFYYICGHCTRHYPLDVLRIVETEDWQGNLVVIPLCNIHCEKLWIERQARLKEY